LTDNPPKAALLCSAKKSADVLCSGVRRCGQNIRPTASAAASTLPVETRLNAASRAAGSCWGMLVALATARPFALFEAYNICGRGGWEGDLMAVGA
jgi:hypothetical protein